MSSSSPWFIDLCRRVGPLTVEIPPNKFNLGRGIKVMRAFWGLHCPFHEQKVGREGGRTNKSMLYTSRMGVFGP
jgi:hypothetical protein